MSENHHSLKIAVIGSGISGLGAAWLLARRHQVTLYEAGDYFGGHANTVSVKDSNKETAVDTGFIVCNDRNYPCFLSLMDHLKVAYTETDMSFGVSVDRGHFEYAGADSLGPLLAQKRNLLRPRFWSMVTSLLRFYRTTSAMDVNSLGNQTLADYLAAENYSPAFIRDHILPMAAAVWSTPSDKVGDFPLKSFLRFCQNHGLLQVNNRPQWYTIKGGSKQYVSALIKDTKATFHKNCPVVSLQRESGQVIVTPASGKSERFDRVLVATHADTALSLLSDADAQEKHILGGFTYANNTAVLHSDPSFMPKRKKAWSSWNYLQEDGTDFSRLSVTYWMNKLQPLGSDTPYFVTLNPARPIDPALTHYTKVYQHPIFDDSTLAAQHAIHGLMGHRNIWYAGAHMGYGFHEDGLQSGLYAAEQIGMIQRPDFIAPETDRIIGLQGHTDAGQFTQRMAAE